MIKVKSQRSNYIIIIAFVLLPLVFMILSAIIGSYITSLIVTFSIYLLFSIAFFVWLKKKQSVYDIVADERTIII